MNIKHYLEEHHVPFEVMPHVKTFDALHLAEAVHVPGKEVAKTVLLRADHGFRYVVAILPSTHRIDFSLLSESLGGATVTLASEQEIADRCPDCEVGALPPFGSCIGAETIVDTSLAEDEEIVFEGNTHHEAIRMKYQDFSNIEHPLQIQFGRQNK